MTPIPTAELLPGRTRDDVADTTPMLSLEQVAQLSGVATADLQSLVDHGVLTPVGDPSTFRLDCVMTLQLADHLRHDLALDGHGFELVMMLLSTVTDAEDQLRASLPAMYHLETGAYLEDRTS